jgi:hypothetical protein
MYGRNLITPRTQVYSNLKPMIGRVLKSNIFPTFLGRLIYIYDEKCYFEILSNPEFTKYNMCEGQIEYITEDRVCTMEFLPEEKLN